MPVSFKWDTIEGSEAELTPDQTRVVRTGLVKDIDMSVPSIALVDVVNTPGFPAMYSAIHSSKPHLLLQRIRLIGLSEFKGWVRVALEYMTESSDFQPTVYVVTDDTYVTQVTSPFIPGTKIPITANFPAQSGVDEVKADLIMGTFFRPARAINVTSLRYGRPSGGYQGKVGMVNDAEWPTGNVQVPGGLSSPGGVPIPDGFGSIVSTNSAEPLPIGYWMISRYRTQWNRQGWCMIEAQAATRVFEDWSEIFSLQNKSSGRYPFGELPYATKVSILTSVMGADYNYGYIAGGETGASGLQENSGIARIGPAPKTNFAAIFGF
jgi:hypothetical protein